MNLIKILFLDFSKFKLGYRVKYWGLWTKGSKFSLKLSLQLN
jgi:hypothetical protein